MKLADLTPGTEAIYYAGGKELPAHYLGGTRVRVIETFRNTANSYRSRYGWISEKSVARALRDFAPYAKDRQDLNLGGVGSIVAIEWLTPEGEPTGRTALTRSGTLFDRSWKEYKKQVEAHKAYKEAARIQRKEREAASRSARERLAKVLGVEAYQLGYGSEVRLDADQAEKILALLAER